MNQESPRLYAGECQTKQSPTNQTGSTVALATQTAAISVTVPIPEAVRESY
ncbi:DUF4058 family protein [Microseira wollei]|uniref:DUF4058 family protein n=1 Tax=Microseira wollei TaxID=467598 RepID=UPI001CFD4683|nr:DUF4058 family protein [Microseira wollei]